MYDEISKYVKTYNTKFGNCSFRFPDPIVCKFDDDTTQPI